jgi:hypothetical protein
MPETIKTLEELTTKFPTLKGLDFSVMCHVARYVDYTDVKSEIEEYFSDWDDDHFEQTIGVPRTEYDESPELQDRLIMRVIKNRTERESGDDICEATGEEVE